MPGRQAVPSVRARLGTFRRNTTFLLQLLRDRTQRKHWLRWIRTLQPDSFMLHPQPWLVFDAMDVLERLDLRGKWVFEFGSGGSTLFWLQQGARCVSVEHDRGWYEKISAMVAGNKALDYRLVEPDADLTADAQDKDPGDPASYASAERTSPPLSYARYVAQIDEFADQSFDLILIDGRARPSCIAHSVTKAKVGGIIILDNAERAYYLAQTEKLLTNYSCRRFFGAGRKGTFFWQTNFYTRLA